MVILIARNVPAKNQSRGMTMGSWRECGHEVFGSETECLRCHIAELEAEIWRLRDGAGTAYMELKMLLERKGTIGEQEQGDE